MVKSLAFYGNTCNNFYQIAKVLKELTDIDVHLYLDIRHDFQMLPESDDAELRDNYPAWIHKGDYISQVHHLLPWKSSLIQELNRHEAVILSFNGPMLGPYLTNKRVFYVSGGDLTLFPFPFRSLRYYDSLLKKVGAVFRGVWQSRGIRSMDQIWSQPFSPFSYAANRLGVEKRVSAHYFPILIDAQAFSPQSTLGEDEETGAILKDLRERFDRYIFYPSRIKTDASEFMVLTGQWKNNVLFLEGFAQYVRENSDRRTALVLIDKVGGKDNEDYVIFKQKVAQLGLEDLVVWLQPRQNGGFKRVQLIQLYKHAFAVADDFGVGWFGSIVTEGLAMAKPVFCYVDEQVMAELYPWHPILSVRDTASIAGEIGRLVKDRRYYDEIGARGREWILEYHDKTSAGRIYIDRFEKAGL